MSVKEFRAVDQRPGQINHGLAFVDMARLRIGLDRLQFLLACGHCECVAARARDVFGRAALWGAGGLTSGGRRDGTINP